MIKHNKFKKIKSKINYENNSLNNAILNQKSNDKVFFYPELISQIYYNDFPKRDKDFLKERQRRTINFYGFKDDLNLQGFRSTEFVNNVDFLIAGCSLTFGHGLPKDYIWHELLLKNTGYSYNSVALSGDSIIGQIFNIFFYIKKYGNPKNILFLIPEFNRLKFFNNKELSQTQSMRRYEVDQDKNLYLNILNTYYNNTLIDANQNKKQFFKRPLNPSDVVPEEVAHLYSAQGLNILEMYCKVAGINLLYGSWDEMTESLLEFLKNENYFLNFINLESNKWKWDKHNEVRNYEKDECHNEYKNNELFWNAADKDEMGSINAHPGLHFNIHIRDIFAKELNKKFGYNFKIGEKDDN